MTGLQPTRRSIGLSARALALAAAMLVGIVAGIGLSWSLLPKPPFNIDPSDARVGLHDVEREVIRYFGTRDLTSGELRQQLTAQQVAPQVALFDVRTEAEYAMGHLPGSVRVDPDMTAAEFLAAHAAKLKGRTAVFYCAVGVRSSVMLQRVAKAGAPVEQAYNLRGGIFRWVADGGQLATAAGPGKPHPYDDAWGELLRRSAGGQ